MKAAHDMVGHEREGSYHVVAQPEFERLEPGDVCFFHQPLVSRQSHGEHGGMHEKPLGLEVQFVRTCRGVSFGQGEGQGESICIVVPQRMEGFEI